MKTTLANIISVVFHPLFIPLSTLLVLLNSNAFFAVILNVKFKYFLLVYTLITGVLLPLISAAFMKKAGIISSIRMPSNKERVIPFALTAVFYYIAYYSLSRFEHLPSIYSLLFLTTSGILFITAFISYFWKISVHTIAAGAAAGLFFVLSRDNAFFFIPFIAAVLIAGVVASARLILDTHSQTQVYTGFLLGFFLMFIFFTW